MDQPLNPGLVVRCYKRTQEEGPLTLQTKSPFDLEREAMDPQPKRNKRALSDIDPNIFEYQVPRMRFEDPQLDVVNQYEIEASKSGPHDEQAMMDLSQKDVYIRTPAQRRVARETYNLAKQANPDFDAAFKNAFDCSTSSTRLQMDRLDIPTWNDIPSGLITMITSPKTPFFAFKNPTQ